MPYPVKVDVSYSYTGFAAGLGNGTFPGSQMDADLTTIETSANALNDFVRLLTRADGRLANGLVTPDTLSSEAKAAFNSSFTPRGAWTTATAYGVGDVVSTMTGTRAYVCVAAHTSAGAFATDLTAGRWLLWATDGNTATAISMAPVGGLSATDVQSGLAELDTEKQAASAVLTALSGVSPAADRLPYFTGAAAMALTPLTAVARTLLDDTTLAAMRTTLELGALAQYGLVTTALLDDTAVTAAKLATGAVTTAKLADGGVTADKLASGMFLRALSTSTGAVSSGSGTFTLADSIPQISSGNEFLTQTITNLGALNTFEVEVLINLAGSTAGGTIIVALFDGTTNALAATAVKFTAANDLVQAKLLYRGTFGATIASTTFRVRAGLAAAGTVTMNGTGGTRTLGGVLLSSIVVREFKA